MARRSFVAGVPAPLPSVPGHRNPPDYQRAPGVPWSAPDNFGGYNTTGMSDGRSKADGSGINKPMAPIQPQSGPQKPAEPVRR